MSFSEYQELLNLLKKFLSMPDFSKGVELFANADRADKIDAVTGTLDLLGDAVEDVGKDPSEYRRGICCLLSYLLLEAKESVDQMTVADMLNMRTYMIIASEQMKEMLYGPD